MTLYIKYIKIPKTKKERKETIPSAIDIEVVSMGMRKALAAHPQSSSVLSLPTCDLHQLLCLLTTHLLFIPTKSGFPPHRYYPAASSITQIRSVTQSCPTLCDPMSRSTPGLPVHHQLPEFTQTHVLRVSDAIQPSHPLSSPSPPAPNPSQHQSLFQ